MRTISPLTLEDAGKLGMNEGDEQTGGQVIARAAAVLGALEGEVRGLTIAQITRATALPRSTVQRITDALHAQQMVLADGRLVRLGPAITRLAGSAHLDVVSIVRPHLETLGRTTRETANLSVLRGNHAVLVDQVASDRELRVVTPVGRALPLHCTAHGKALLATMSDDEVAQRLGETLERRTARTIVSRSALYAYLGEARATRTATDEDEHLDGVSGVGCVLLTSTPERFALSVVMPSIRFAKARADVEKAVLVAKAAIEACF